MEYTIWNCIKPGLDIALILQQMTPLLEAEISLLDRYSRSMNQVRDYHLRERFFEVRNGREYLKRCLKNTIQLRSN